MLVNETLIRVVHVAYVAGGLLAVGCGGLAGMRLILGSPWRSPMALLIFCALLAMGCGGVGVLLLARSLNHGRLRAFYGLCLLLALLAPLGTMMVLFSRSLQMTWVFLPVFGLGATCLNAWGVVRGLRRKRWQTKPAPAAATIIPVAPPPPAQWRTRGH